jgi:protein SCO1
VSRSPHRLRTAAVTGCLALALTACGDASDDADADVAADETTSSVASAPQGVIRGMERDPVDVGAISMPDAAADGEEFAFVAPEGGLLLVYFGYTHCPDVCPTTLSDVRTALGGLGDDAELIDLAMVTIDPARDTPDVLGGYVQSFVDDAHALTTTDEGLLREAADAFGADYRLAEGDDGEPVVEHTGFLYVVDDTGQLVLAWPYGQSSDDIAHDLGVLLEEA